MNSTTQSETQKETPSTANDSAEIPTKPSQNSPKQSSTASTAQQKPQEQESSSSPATPPNKEKPSYRKGFFLIEDKTTDTNIVGSFGLWGDEIRWDLPDPRASNEIRTKAEQTFANGGSNFTLDGAEYTLVEIPQMR